VAGLDCEQPKLDSSSNGLVGKLARRGGLF
jgi:hypothetical protein